MWLVAIWNGSPEYFTGAAASIPCSKGRIQPLQLRHETFAKNLAMVSPTTGIRQLQNWTAPSRCEGGAPHIVLDGLYQDDDGSRFEHPDFSHQRGLARNAGSAP